MADDLTVTISESVAVQGQTFSQGAEHTYSNIYYYTKYIKALTPADTWVELYTASADGTGADYKDADIDYVRIKNLDDTNAIELALITADTYHYFAIPAGGFYIIQNHDDLIDDDSSLKSIESVKAGNATSVVNVEVFIALNAIG